MQVPEPEYIGRKIYSSPVTLSPGEAEKTIVADVKDKEGNLPPVGAKIEASFIINGNTIVTSGTIHEFLYNANLNLISSATSLSNVMGINYYPSRGVIGANVYTNGTAKTLDIQWMKVNGRAVTLKNP